MSVDTHNASEREERSLSGDSTDEPIEEVNTTIRLLLPCQNVAGPENDTDDGTLLALEQIVNGTVAVVRSTIRTEEPTTTPTESEEKTRSGAKGEQTEPAPTERTTSTDDRQPSMSTTPVEEAAPIPTPTASIPATTPSAPTTTRPAATEPTITDRHPDRETATAVSLSVSVHSSNDSNDGSNPPGGKRLPLEPEQETGAAVGLGATAVRVLLKHGSTAPETMSRPHDSASIRIRLTTVIGSLSRIMVLLRYSRYDDSDPLEHDGRAIVFKAIEKTPGIYLSAISDHTEYSLSTLRHHLRVLEREGLIMSVKVHGKRRFYPVDTERIELTAALGEEATANVIKALCHLGPATVSELADELDRDPSTVTHHLQRLDNDDIVCRRRSGRVVINRLSDDVVTYLTERPNPYSIEY